MNDFPHNYWNGVNHPYRMVEKHYCESAWNLVKQNKISVWGSFEPIEVSEEIDWAMNPLNDETWSFYFNGLSWLYSHLWAIDHNEQKPDMMFDIIRQYHRHISSENPNKMVWFDHSTSDRLSILSVISMHSCINMADENTRRIIDELLELHIKKIIEFKESKKWINSNHGVFHSLALLNASLLESVTNLNPDIKEIGLQYLSDTLSTILSISEFISLEQSAYYHQLAISLIESLEPGQLSELGIDKHKFIEKMKDSNHWLTCTEKKLIAIGDTSVISNISAKHAPVNEPTKLGISYQECGVSFAKYKTESGWNHFSFLHRDERAPHGHFDALSITLSKESKEFIVDSGGPYRYGNPLRFSYFMSSYAHNVALVDGKKHEAGAKLLNSKFISDEIFVVEAEHKGYYPITHNRRCVYVKNKGLAVFDSFSNVERKTNIQLLWHMHPECELSDDYSRISNEGRTVWVRNDLNTQKEVVSGVEGDSPQGWVTTGIGLKKPCPTLIDSIDVEEDTVIVTYFEYEENCLQNIVDIKDIHQLNETYASEPIVPFGFNDYTIEKYISNDPIFWQPGTYFGDRNIWKINKSQRKLKHLKLTSNEKSMKIKEIIERRIDMKTPTIYIISNGGSGCHYMGGLMSMRAGYKLIDEVYFPPVITNSIELGSVDSTALIEMVNLVHLANLDENELIPINTMHLRKDTPLVKLLENSVNCKFIFLIRNPINIAISRGLRKLDYKMQSKDNSDLSDDEYLKKQADYTKNHFKRLFSKENDVGALLIKYEDLIDDSNKVLKDIFSYIGDELCDDEIDEILVKYNDAKDITKNENRKEKPTLTDTQKEILITELSETCLNLGYEIPPYVKL